MITTVLGDIAPAELGFCQSHEHVYIRPCPARAGEAIDNLEKSLAELKDYHCAGDLAEGTRSLIDAQPIGTGRDVAALVHLAEQSGVHIIASTGFHRLSFYPAGHWIFSASEDDLTRLFITELEQGMYLDGDTAFPVDGGVAQGLAQSRARAGQIKTALDSDGLTPPCRKLFRAAVAAALASGYPLMAHIEQGSDPLELADFLAQRGLPLDRAIFCHLDRAIPDIGVHRELCSRGIYLEYDTIGRPKYHDDKRELEIIIELLNAGYGGKLLLSLDTTRSRLRSYGGSPGLCYIIKDFIPFMLKNGIGEADIKRFFTENPMRVFKKQKVTVTEK